MRFCPWEGAPIPEGGEEEFDVVDAGGVEHPFPVAGCDHDVEFRSGHGELSELTVPPGRSMHSPRLFAPSTTPARGLSPHLAAGHVPVPRNATVPATRRDPPYRSSRDRAIEYVGESGPPTLCQLIEIMDAPVD